MPGTGLAVRAANALLAVLLGLVHIEAGARHDGGKNQDDDDIRHGNASFA